MTRVALSEFAAKRLLFESLNQQYLGVAVDLEAKGWVKLVSNLPKGLYVVKVDQAVKKRNKTGLVKLKRTKTQALGDLKVFAKQGYRYALVEPFIEHDKADEKYISLSRERAGIQINYSNQGGVDIEEHAAELKKVIMPDKGFDEALNKTDLESSVLKALYDLFQSAHMTLLEINPFIVKDDAFMALDAAAQVDSAAEFFVNNAWSTGDVRQPKAIQNPAELVVEELNSKSPASLTLKVLNPNGTYFLLLSGGGASVVVADEIAQLGQHQKIANYGEYSGNPSEDETYIYANEVIGLMLKSKSSKKVLIIAGGVANFTDVGKTFAGIIRALNDNAELLKKQKTYVLVRRGGPNQVKGLKAIKQFLDKAGIRHVVYGPELSLAKSVKIAVGNTK